MLWAPLKRPECRRELIIPAFSMIIAHADLIMTAALAPAAALIVGAVLIPAWETGSHNDLVRQSSPWLHCVSSPAGGSGTRLTAYRAQSCVEATPTPASQDLGSRRG